MTHSEKLEAVTKAIHKACPDLLTVKDGSKGKNKRGHELIKLSEKWYFLSNGCPSDEPVEILGQPIGIESILRAFKASKNDSDYILTIDQVGGLACHSVIDDKIIKFAVWDLVKPLDQQSEEVISLLYSIF